MAKTTHSNAPARPIYFAVDFDGTCIFHAYPKLGPSVPHAVSVLKKIASKGIKLILWTCRAGEELGQAVTWFAEHDIPLFGLNENPDLPDFTSKKVYCDLYIDDKGWGVYLKEFVNPETGLAEKVVNWERLDLELECKGYYEGNVKLTEFKRDPVL